MRVFFWRNYYLSKSGEQVRGDYRICALREDGVCLWNDLKPVRRTTVREGITQEEIDMMDAETHLQLMRNDENENALGVTITEWISDGSRTHYDFQEAYRLHLARPEYVSKHGAPEYPLQTPNGAGA
jgi:hypothetical protein